MGTYASVYVQISAYYSVYRIFKSVVVSTTICAPFPYYRIQLEALQQNK